MIITMVKHLKKTWISESLKKIDKKYTIVDVLYKRLFCYIFCLFFIIQKLNGKIIFKNRRFL